MSYWNFARSPASILIMLAHGRERGIAPGALLKGSHLSPQQLADPDFTVQAAQELVVASNLLDQTGNEPDLGLDLGLSYRLSNYGLLGFGLLSSATGMEAVSLARRYWALTYTYADIGFRRTDQQASFSFAPSFELSMQLQRFFVGRAMGATCRVLKDVIGTDFGLATFDLAYAAATAGSKQILGTRIRHGQRTSAITFSAAFLDRPLPQANAATSAMCERMCAELLSRRRTRLDIAAFLTEYLSAHASGSPPNLHDIATLLNTSERTLKRRLKEEGTSFRDISNTVRQARANALLAEGRLSLGEIAHELGFSDLSSFSQSYKRWTGVAPSQMRLKGHHKQ